MASAGVWRDLLDPEESEAFELPDVGADHLGSNSQVVLIDRPSVSSPTSFNPLSVLFHHGVVAGVVCLVDPLVQDVPGLEVVGPFEDPVQHDMFGGVSVSESVAVRQDEPVVPEVHSHEGVWLVERPAVDKLPSHKVFVRASAHGAEEDFNLADRVRVLVALGLSSGAEEVQQSVLVEVVAVLELEGLILLGLVLILETLALQVSLEESRVG